MHVAMVCVISTPPSPSTFHFQKSNCLLLLPVLRVLSEPNLHPPGKAA